MRCSGEEKKKAKKGKKKRKKEKEPNYRENRLLEKLHWFFFLHLGPVDILQTKSKLKKNVYKIHKSAAEERSP